MGGKQVEYKSFIKDETVRDEAMAAEMAKLMSRVTGGQPVQTAMQTVADISSPDVLTESQPELEPDHIRLRLLDRAEEATTWQWEFDREATITIGRDASNNVVVMDGRVSRQHAVIKHDGNAWQYMNKGTNGSFRNAEQVDQFAIQDGDVVQLSGRGPRIQFDLPQPT